jgi:hypothetical protein
LDISYRQVRRLWKRFQQQGKEGLRHQSCGKASGRAKPKNVRTSILARYQERYRDFGPTLAAEKLTEEGFPVDHETLRRWLLESGDWSKGRRKKLHRNRRKSREHFGELVQMDGSFHAWFEERGEHATLMSMIDDATNTSLALLSEMETTESALQILWKWIECYVVFLSASTPTGTASITAPRVNRRRRSLAGLARTWAFASSLPGLLRPKDVWRSGMPFTRIAWSKICVYRG